MLCTRSPHVMRRIALDATLSCWLASVTCGMRRPSSYRHPCSDARAPLPAAHLARLTDRVTDPHAARAHAGELANVLREAGHPVPPELTKFGTHVKKKESKLCVPRPAA